MITTKPYRGTQSVLRAVSLLKVFDDEHPEWGLGDLSRETGLNKTTAFRLLSALESEGMVARNDTGDCYVLGPEILVLGGRALRANSLRQVSRAGLEALAASTGETASLEILSGTEMMIIDEVMGEHLVSGVRSIGTRWPAHGASTGLALLAFGAQETREAFLQKPLTPITAKTIIDPKILRPLLAQFAEQGYAVADEILELGLIAIGAPLYNYDGRIVAAISIFGPKSRLTQARVAIVGGLVRDTAVDISSKLGYQPKQKEGSTSNQESGRA
jgi:DNA-binding IclR family transcriptional regulator